MIETRFVAKALLFDSERNFLRLTRSDSHPTLAGYYDLPGGTVEEGEEPGHAIIREIQEETGLEIPPTQVKVVYATTSLIHGRNFPTLLYVVELFTAQPEIILSYEHKAAEWRNLDDLAGVEPHIAPTYREALDYLRHNAIIPGI